jgi:hypothetical protein
MVAHVLGHAVPISSAQPSTLPAGVTVADTGEDDDLLDY